MKKIYAVVLLVMFTATAAFSQQHPYYPKPMRVQPAAGFQLQVFQPANYELQLNGMAYGFRGTQFNMPNIAPGTYRFSLYVVQPRQKRLVYKGVVAIDAGVNVIATLDNARRLVIEQQFNGQCDYWDDFYCAQPPVNEPVYMPFMSNNDFNGLLGSVKRGRFDSDREKIARQGVAYNNLSAEQVKLLVSVFSFDQSRLELAKYAFDRSNDKGRFYMVNDAFTFSSSIDELNAYMQRQ